MLEQLRQKIAFVLGVLFILTGVLGYVSPGRAGWFLPSLLPPHQKFLSAIAIVEILCGVGLLYRQVRGRAGFVLVLVFGVSWSLTTYGLDVPFAFGTSDVEGVIGTEARSSTRWELRINGQWEDVWTLPQLEFPLDVPHAMRVRIPRITTDRIPWHIQLYRGTVAVVKNERYVLHFRARADGVRSIHAAVGRAHGDWASLGLYKEVWLSGEWQQFDLAFQATDDDSNSQIFFNLGQEAHDVEFSAVRLEHVAANATLPLSPLWQLQVYGPWSAPTVRLLWILLLIWCSEAWRRPTTFVRHLTWPHLWQATFWWAGLVSSWSFLRPLVDHYPVGTSTIIYVLGSLSSSLAIGCMATTLRRWAEVLAPEQQRRFLQQGSLVNLLATIDLLLLWRLPGVHIVTTGVVALMPTVFLLCLGKRKIIVQMIHDYHALPQKIKRLRQGKWEANATFWGLLIGLMFVLHVGLGYRDADISRPELFFITVNRLLIYTVLIGILALFLQIARRVTPLSVLHFYTGLVGTLPIFCVLDYLVTRQTGRTLLPWINILFTEETLETATLQIRDLFQWANVPVGYVVAGSVGVTLVTVGCMSVTAPLSQRLCQTWSNGQVVVVLALCGFLGVVSDICGPRLLAEPTWQRLRQTSSVEFLSTQFIAAYSISSIPMQFRTPAAPSDTERLLAKVTPLTYRPDIFLFMLESVRIDAVTPDVAPRLSAFRSQCLPAERMFAGSYGSELSWFSLFHGYHAFRWQQLAGMPYQGAYPLRLLKHLGYEVQARMGGDFRWKELGEVIFGTRHTAADLFIDASGQLGDSEYHVRDRLLMNDLVRTMTSTPPGGHLFVHEIDSTHWPYSWPPHFQVPHHEYAPFIDFTKAQYTPEEIQLVKNRYDNALHWADHLFGEFEDQLKITGRFDDSIVIVVGDHGEEFYETGIWGHSSRLNRQETEVPIFIKLPGQLGQYQPRRFLSHVDIMPTIFMALNVQPQLYSFLEGISIDKPRETLLVSSLGDTPWEPGLVFVHPTMKVQLAYWSQSEQDYPDRLRVYDYVDFRDNKISSVKRPGQTDVELLREYFPELLQQLFASFPPGRDDTQR